MIKRVIREKIVFMDDNYLYNGLNLKVPNYYKNPSGFRIRKINFKQFTYIAGYILVRKVISHKVTESQSDKVIKLLCSS